MKNTNVYDELYGSVYVRNPIHTRIGGETFKG